MYGDIIKKIRKELGLNQKNFGDALGLSQSQIGSIEKGYRALTDRTKNDIIREYGVNPIYLETGEGEMFVQVPKLTEAIARLIPKLESLTVEQLESIEKLIEAFGKVGE